MDPIHISRLKLIAKSPLHYRAGFVGPETYAMERGDAVHSMIFETCRVVSMAEGKQRRGKDYDAFVADNPDALILTYGDGQKVLGMVKAIQSCPQAMQLLDGTRETLREWSIGDRPCAGTPDVYNDRHRFVTELKTTVSSQPDRFMWQALRMGYMAQLAWYQDGLQLGGAPPPEIAYIVAVESTAPFPVTVFRLTDRALEQGRRAYRLWFEQMLNCERVDQWPPYAQGVVALDVPEDDPELDFGDGESEAA